jgi:hypothetical protein
MEEGAMETFDPTVIERCAAHLERKAGTRVTGLTLLGALVGAFLGGMPLFALLHTAVPHRYGYALLIAGAACGGFLGFSLGESRTAGLRLQAQLAQHQLHLEMLMRRLDQMPAPATLHAPAPAAPAPVAPTPPPALVSVWPAEWAAPPATAVRTSP